MMSHSFPLSSAISKHYQISYSFTTRILLLFRLLLLLQMSVLSCSQTTFNIFSEGSCDKLVRFSLRASLQPGRTGCLPRVRGALAVCSQEAHMYVLGVQTVRKIHSWLVRIVFCFHSNFPNLYCCGVSVCELSHPFMSNSLLPHGL